MGKVTVLKIKQDRKNHGDSQLVQPSYQHRSNSPRDSLHKIPMLRKVGMSPSNKAILMLVQQLLLYRLTNLDRDCFLSNDLA